MFYSCYKSKLVAFLVLLIVSSSVVADDDWKQTGNSKATKLDSCVAPEDVMRREHMNMLKHQRDITVHQGIRKTDDSLAGCIDCHANHDDKGQPIPVNAEGQFCAECHTYVSAQLDCFGCHATVPAIGSKHD